MGLQCVGVAAMAFSWNLNSDPLCLHESSSPLAGTSLSPRGPSQSSLCHSKSQTHADKCTSKALGCLGHEERERSVWIPTSGSSMEMEEGSRDKGGAMRLLYLPFKVIVLCRMGPINGIFAVMSSWLSSRSPQPWHC